MPQTWDEVESSQDFKALEAPERAEVQRRWFAAAVEPQLEAKDREDTRQWFFAKFPHGNEDPAYGQTIGEGMAASFEQGLQKGLSATFLSGPGAVLEAVGAEDNPLIKAGRAVEEGIEADTPVSQKNEERWPVKAAGAIGQGASMVATAPLAGTGQTFKAASFIGKARQLAFMGGLQGASAGEAEATRLGITDPLAKSTMILGYGAVEALSEKLGGYEVESSIVRAFTGGQLTGHILKKGAMEGLEEVGAGVPQRTISMLLAHEDPNNKGYTVEGQPIFAPWDLGQIFEEWTLGTVAGTTITSAAHAINKLTPQQQRDTSNVAGLPQQLRKAGWDALQKITADEAAAVPAAAAIDEETAKAMRVAFDGRRAKALEDLAKETEAEFAPGWEERERMPLVHRGESLDTFFDKGEWVVTTGTNEQGQPVFAPAENAQSLETARQEFIRTGDIPEGMQPLVSQTPPSVAPTAESVAPGAPSVEATPPSSVEPAAPAEPVPAAPLSFKDAEVARVRQAYPNSPQLIEGIEMANGEAGVRAYLDKNEPRAQLMEELAPLSPFETEELLRTEGVPEKQIGMIVTGGTVNTNSAANAIARTREQRGGPAPAPAPVAEKPKAAEPKKKRRSAPREVIGDILDMIEEHGGLMSASVARAARGEEWWAENSSLYDDAERLSLPSHNFIYGGTMTPDEMHSHLRDNEKIMGPDTDVRDLWRDVVQASKGRRAQHQQAAAERRAQAEGEKQQKAWSKATQDGRRPVTTFELTPGDTLDVEGEPVLVRGVVVSFNEERNRATIETATGEQETLYMPQAAPGDFVLEDGALFGRQRLSTGEAIWVEKHERETEIPDEGEGFGREQSAPAASFEDMLASTPTGPPTVRQQVDEFELRLRETIDEGDLAADWTNADVEAAVRYHASRSAEDLPDFAKRQFVWGVERGMRTPAEQHREERQEQREVQTAIEEANPGTSHTAPSVVHWADGIVREGQVGMNNIVLLAAHAVRTAHWIKTNGLDFARWSARMVAQFGRQVRSQLQRIWDHARQLLHLDNELDDAALTAIAENARIPTAPRRLPDDEGDNFTDPPAARSIEERRGDAVRRILERVAESQGAATEFHEEDGGPILAVRAARDGSLTVRIHRDHIAAVAKLTPAKRREMMQKYRSLVALNSAYRSIWMDRGISVPLSWNDFTTARQQIAGEIYGFLRRGYDTTPEVRELFTVALEVMAERPFRNAYVRGHELGNLTYELNADPEVAVDFVNHIVRLTSERQTGRLSEEAGGMFIAQRLWRARVVRTLDKFIGPAEEGAYGAPLKLLLDEMALNKGQSAVAAAQGELESAALESQLRAEARAAVKPLSPLDLAQRARANPYREGVWQASQAIAAEMKEAGDLPPRFVRNAKNHGHLPELVAGAPFAVESTGRPVIVTDQVHVTLADRRTAQKNDRSAAGQALHRVIQEAQNAAHQVKRNNAGRIARAEVSRVLDDIQTSQQWPVIVADLWAWYRIELENRVAAHTGDETRALRAGARFLPFDPTARQQARSDRSDAARAWIAENFGPQMAQVIAGEQGIALTMLPPLPEVADESAGFAVGANIGAAVGAAAGAATAGAPGIALGATLGGLTGGAIGGIAQAENPASAAAEVRLWREVEDTVKTAVQPYMGRIRFSASMRDRFIAGDEENKRIHNADAAQIRAINAEEVLAEVTDPDARQWGTDLLERYARLVETGQLDDRHLDMAPGRDYLPIYASFFKGQTLLYTLTLEKVRAAVRKITGDTADKYGIIPKHVSYRQGFLLGSKAEAERLRASSTARRLPDKSERQEPRDGSGGVEERGPRFSTPRPKVVVTGVSAADVKAAVQGLAKILPNADTAWSGTRKELEAALRADPEFGRQWKDDWQDDHPGQPRTAANEAFEDFITYALNKREGFTFRGRTYLINDQIDVTEADGNAANAARRVLVHEDAHEGLDHLRKLDAKVEQKWQEFRASIPSAELQDLVEFYPWLADWQTDETQHDDLAHEWWAARIAEIEERGQPESDSLLGRFVTWLRDAFRTLMGTATNPDNLALLEFMDAARTARFMARADAVRQGLRFSASNQGDLPSRHAVEVQVEGQDATTATLHGNPKQRYNLWSPARQAAYEAFQSNPDLPDDMKHFTQVLGQQTDDERITQSLRPMVEMSNRRLGGVHGEQPEINEENTEQAYADARALHTRKTFARKLIEEFRMWHAPKDAEGNPLHAGDAVVAVHQLGLMNYAVRLLAQTGDAKLMVQMAPFANDVILGDFATMSAAGRLLQVRSLASRNSVGHWTALALTHGAQHDAAGSKVGEEARDTIARSISSDEVKEEIAAGMAQFAEEQPEGQAIAAEAEAAIEQYEEEGYLQRAWELLDPEERALAKTLDEVYRRLDELEQIRLSIEAEKAGSKARPSMSESERWASEKEKFRKDPVGLQKQIDALKQRAKELLRKLTKQDTSNESKAKRRKRVRDHKAAHKALSADAEAKKLIARYEDRNKRTKRDVPKWRQAFNDQIRNPKPEADFLATMAAENVETATAERMFDLAATLRTERAQARREAAARRRDATADQRLEKFGDKAGKMPDPNKKPGDKKLSPASFVNALVRQILNTKRSVQMLKTTELDEEGEPTAQDGSGHANPWNPAWVKEAFSNAFVEHGIPRDRANEMADKLSGKFESIMRNAQTRAAMKAGKALNVAEPTMQKIGQAIRSGAIDPMNANPVIKALAEEAGFAGLSHEDFQRLAQLDEVINESVPTLAAKAYTEVSRIMAKARPPKKFTRVLEQLFINGALSSMGVMQLNWLHPTYLLPRMLMTDLQALAIDAARGRGNRVQNMRLMGETFKSLWAARHGMLSDAIFSLKNDAYTSRILELLSIEHSLYKELMEAWEKLTTGNIGERAIALPKVMWLSGDWVRRMLSSADQMWGGVLHDYVMRNEALRRMVQDAGLTVEQAGLVLQQAVDNGKAAQERHEAQGNDHAESVLVGRDVMRKSLSQGLLHKTGKAGSDVDLIATAEKTYQMELGNRKGEDAPWWDFFNWLEVVKAGATAVRRRFDKMNVPAGRAVTGFVSVASNILNRSAYFTPLGFARVWAKTHGSQAKREAIYKETMATEAMTRARLNEAIIGTLSMAVLALLKLKWDDEDEWFGITGNGPKNPAMREAWLKQGHKPGFIEFRDGRGNVMVALPYTRGGFDHLAPTLTVVGALDDMELDGIRPRKKDFNWGWTYAQTIAGNQIRQAQFYGVRAAVGAVPSSERPHAAAGWVSYTINPWTPWGGLSKSLYKMMSGAQEQGSVSSAFLSNMPVAQIITGNHVGPKLNFLGDQIGGQSETMLKQIAERASYAGLPFYVPLNPDAKDEDIYDFIMQKGVAPSVPLRSEMESKNGFLDDKQWSDYVKARGDLLKDAIRRQMPRLQMARPADAQSIMETISRDATREAKRRLKLE